MMDKTRFTIGILGCGWIGTPLAKYLKAQNHRVIGTTTTPAKVPQLVHLGLDQVVVGSLCPAWQGEAPGPLFESEILIICFPPGKKSDENLHQEQMKTLLTLINNHTKVVYVSSTSVYPALGREVYEQDVSTVEQAAHGKIAKAEAVLSQHLKDRLTILRCGGLTGWDRNLAKHFAGKENLEGGELPVNLVHGEDVIRALATIISKEVYGETYNLVAPWHPSKAQFYTQLCLKSGLPLPVFSQATESPKFKIVNSDKIQRHLGFTFNFPDPMEFTYY